MTNKQNFIFFKLSWALLFLVLGSSYALASADGQEVRVSEVSQADSKISGLITDHTGESIIGASIVVVGTSNGTITDIDGKFSITASASARLLVSYIGYQSIEISVNGQSSIKIVLIEDFKELDEFVVVGYGVQKKSSLTGSVSTLKTAALESRPVSSVSAALAGQMPGVTSIQTSGAPGSQTGSITIRGKNSINAASPLVIVDGVPGDMNTIDPSDIESLSVLKDASSAAIYGVQAANGVILITTKKGKKGDKAKVSYSGNVAWTSPTARLKFLGAGDYAMLYNEATLNDNPNATISFSDEDIRKFRDGSSPSTHPNTDWYNETFKSTAMEQMHHMSINGGAEKTNYNASIGFTEQDGFLEAINYKRYNGRLSVDSRINNWLAVGLNASANRGISNQGWNSFSSMIGSVNRSSPTVGVYGKPNDYGSGDFSNSGKPNPVAQIGRDGFRRSTRQQLHSILHGTVFILPELSVKGVFSVRNNMTLDEGFKKKLVYNGLDEGPREGYSNNFHHNWYTTQVLSNYYKNFDKHSFALLGGFEQTAYHYTYTEAARKGGGNNNLMESLNTLDAASQTNSDGGRETARRSYFGRIQYQYDDKYLLEANVRTDASSVFPKDNRWGTFPSFSGAWIISKEGFMKDQEILSFLKIRAGWGKTGNEELKSDNVYPSVSTFDYEKYMFGNSLYSTSKETRYVNNQLKWATVTSYDLGLEASFLDNLIGFELALYKKMTDGMLLKLPVEGILGMDAPVQNAGKVENKGFDLSVFHNMNISQDFRYNLNFNLAYVKNKITEMRGTSGVDPDNSKYWRVEGYPIGSFYGYQAIGFFNTAEELASLPNRTGAEQLGDIRYQDLDKNDKITAAGDRTVIGKNFPSWTLGFNANFEYKSFDLSFLLQGALDVDAYIEGESAYSFFNGGNVLERHLDRWTPTNHNASYPRITRSDQVNYQVSSFWLEDASYVRLKNVTFGYNLSQALMKKLGGERAKLYISGENLLTFSGLDGIDPEAPSDNRGWFYSNVKKVSLGLKVTF
ncbi:SusC/RagA family TonB-linked outer membrane protein [Bacteroidales bacterium]|nr:SusC/RagA family TonB-linked outer membrane protein [Bacteroidales bacterium]